MKLPSDSDSSLNFQTQKDNAVSVENLSADSLPPGSGQKIHWHSLSDAILFTLIIAGPTMLWEEVWRGRPMIDQKGSLWVVPAVIVIATFFVGGAIAGRHRRRPWGALIQGVALSVPVTLILVIADLARRLILKKSLTLGVVGLWVAAIAGTVAIAVLGALVGRWLYRIRQEHQSLTQEG